MLIAEEYAAMRDQWIKFGAGFLLVYSITDRPTFEAIPGLHQDILRVKDRSYVPCVVVSNKVSCYTSFPFAVVHSCPSRPFGDSEERS